MGRFLKAFGILVAIGVLDIYWIGGVTFDPVACEEQGIRRQGLHQGKNEAYFLYFFIAHVYDNILNPWHWTPDMRTESLTSNGFGLTEGMKVADVGCGTGFTTIGVTQQGVRVQDIHMLDQSPQQLSKARVKPELQGVATITIGDSESLPSNWTGQFDRYVSAGSIEYWPHPQIAIDESARILKPGGKAMIIGPIRATNPISRFFADMWYLFPEEREYISWFEKAGYTNVKIHPITPDWYQGDRSHGLIMGCAVVGTKPSNWVQPTRTTMEPKAQTTDEGNDWILHLLMALPRFALGSVASIYYAIVPILIYWKNIWFGGSVLVTAIVTVSPVLVYLWLDIFPTSWMPYSASRELFDGISDLYDNSSEIWENVWGPHMHTGFYNKKLRTKSSISMDEHLEAQHEMMVQLFKLWNNMELVLTEANSTGKPVRVLDAGCGVGGSSRFLYHALQQVAEDSGLHNVHIEIVGITLSKYQCDRATKLTEEEEIDEHITFKVANALDTKFPDDYFDCVWSLESGEHMPDKEKWLNEVGRILKSNGTFLCASWCHREITSSPLSAHEHQLLGRICKNYSLPEIVPLSKYGEIAAKIGFEGFEQHEQSWNDAIQPFWPAVISSALTPKALLLWLWYGNWTTVKGAVTAFLMKEGFAISLLNFGVFAVVKGGFPDMPEVVIKGISTPVRRSMRTRTPRK